MPVLPSRPTAGQATLGNELRPLPELGRDHVRRARRAMPASPRPAVDLAWLRLECGRGSVTAAVTFRNHHVSKVSEFAHSSRSGARRAYWRVQARCVYTTRGVPVSSTSARGVGILSPRGPSLTTALRCVSAVRNARIARVGGR